MSDFASFMAGFAVGWSAVIFLFVVLASRASIREKPWD